ncbi:hypothetical protein F4777DRAFT_532563 [Nemania sp. FL0916]|nr:hypothetical protein F4777DRAFT_532563 [Nemania sp. FL0916]
MAQPTARRAVQPGPAPQPEPDSDSADNTRKRPRLGRANSNDNSNSNTNGNGNSSSNGTSNGNRNGNNGGSEESTLTSACDQCRIRKIRCDRRQPDCSNCLKAGFECNATNTFKRVNPMKQLRDEFSDVLKHLRDVDETLGTLTNLTRQIAARPCPHNTDPHSHPHPHPHLPSSASSPGAHALPTPPPGFLDPVQPNPQHGLPVALREPLCETVEFDHGGVRLYTYPAPLVMVRSLLRQATGALLDASHRDGNRSMSKGDGLAPALQEPAVQATLRQRLDEFPFHARCPESIAVGDNLAVATPPRLIVNLLGEGYLRNINVRTPIFEDDELRRAIDVHYADDQAQQSYAWALILNNIVLLQLGLEIQTARASHSQSHGMNDEIIPSFLKNCHRAIGNLDAFMAPSLVNVQALMTLTLVAREFYNSATAERVCHAACQVGRAMGLHRFVGVSPDESSSEAERIRHRLFRVLYAMDKQRVFMTGQPCDLHMFDADHQIGSSRSHTESSFPISDAFDDMMTIWEEIYLNLYTSRAVVASAETRARQVQLVSNSIYKFARTHSDLISTPSFGGPIADSDLMLIELVYGYHVSQVLILRCDRNDEQGLEKMHEFARSSLRVILEVGRGPLTTARLGLLASMFRRYPMVAFIELVAFRLANLFATGDYNAAAQADVALLRAICDQVHILQHGNLPHSFYARLRMGLVWALETLEAMGESFMGPSIQAQQPAGLSPPRTESSRSTEPPSHQPIVGPNPTIPEILNACNLHQSKGSQDLSRMTPTSRRSDEGFGHSGLAEFTNFGFLTPGTDRMDRMDFQSGPLSGSHFGAVSAAPSQLELSTGSIPSHPDWNDFNVDFFQGSLA